MYDFFLEKRGLHSCSNSASVNKFRELAGSLIFFPRGSYLFRMYANERSLFSC